MRDAVCFKHSGNNGRANIVLCISIYEIKMSLPLYKMIFKKHSVDIIVIIKRKYVLSAIFTICLTYGNHTCFGVPGGNQSTSLSLSLALPDVSLPIIIPLLIFLITA